MDIIKQILLSGLVLTFSQYTCEIAAGLNHLQLPLHILCNYLALFEATPMPVVLKLGGVPPLGGP